MYAYVGPGFIQNQDVSMPMTWFLELPPVRLTARRFAVAIRDVDGTVQGVLQKSAVCSMVKLIHT